MFQCDLLKPIENLVRYDPDIRLPDGNVYPFRTYYTPECRACPSVSTLLGETSDKTWLEDWRKRIGKQKADAIARIAAERGDLLHRSLQCKLQNQEIDIQGAPDDIFRVKQISTVLENWNRKRVLGKIRAIEYAVYSNRYAVAGTIDLVAYLGPYLTLFDYKTSRRNPWKDTIENYFEQESLYAESWNERFPEEPIKLLVVINASDDEIPANVYVRSVKSIKSADLLTKRQKFREMFNL